MSHAALSTLGRLGQVLIQADRNYIWADPAVALLVDVDIQEERLRLALGAQPGLERDDLMVEALANEGRLLEDEPLADWALRPREHLEWARQEARLALARDRAKGFGRSSPPEVVDAWEACLTHDPTCEEATSALMRVHAAHGKNALVVGAYQRCRTALEELGLRTSPALEEVREATSGPAPSPAPAAAPTYEMTIAPVPLREERRLVSVLFAEVSAHAGFRGIDLEDLRDMVGTSISQLIAEVENLGGTVTSVSGAGLSAMFGAPVSHEDDPERAVRAAYRALSRTDGFEPLSLRVGIETGPAIVGPIGARGDYGAVGEVVSAAAAIQSVAKPGSVLVGPATHAGTETIFEWGPTDEVVPNFSTKPLVATYLDQPKRRDVGWRGRNRRGGRARLVGREEELAALDHAVRDAISGAGSVIFVVGEPGLGKTRLVQECRKRFMAWVGARHRAFAALAGRTLRVVRLVNSLWSLPTTSLRLDWSSTGRRRKGGASRLGASHEGRVRRRVGPRRVPGPHDWPRQRLRAGRCRPVEPRAPTAGDLCLREGAGVAAGGVGAHGARPRGSSIGRTQLPCG